MNRDLGYYWMRLLMYVAIALSLGTVFYNIGFDYDSIQVSSFYTQSVPLLFESFYCFSINFR